MWTKNGAAHGHLMMEEYWEYDIGMKIFSSIEVIEMYPQGVFYEQE